MVSIFFVISHSTGSGKTQGQVTTGSEQHVQSVGTGNHPVSVSRYDKDQYQQRTTNELQRQCNEARQTRQSGQPPLMMDPNSSALSPLA